MHFTVFEPALQISAQRHLPFNISEDATRWKVNTSNSNQFEQVKRRKINLEIKKGQKAERWKVWRHPMCKKQEEASLPLPLELHLHHKWKKAIKQPLHQRQKQHSPPSPSPPPHSSRHFHPSTATTILEIPRNKNKKNTVKRRRNQRLGGPEAFDLQPC